MQPFERLLSFVFSYLHVSPVVAVNSGERRFPKWFYRIVGEDLFVRAKHVALSVDSPTVDASFLSSLSDMRELTLKGNGVFDADLWILAKFPRLRKLESIVPT